MSSNTDMYTGTFLCGVISGNECDLFSAGAFKCAGVFASSEAQNIQELLNRELQEIFGTENPETSEDIAREISDAGKFFSQAGYVNFIFNDNYIKLIIKKLALKFDRLKSSGILKNCEYKLRTVESNDACVNYDSENDWDNRNNNQKNIIGMSRYCINRILSLCDLFENHELKSEESLNDSKIRKIAVLCMYIYFSSQNEFDSECDLFFHKYIHHNKNIKKSSDELASLFYSSDSCIPNLSVIYLDLYKAVGFILFNEK